MRLDPGKGLAEARMTWIKSGLDRDLGSCLDWIVKRGVAGKTNSNIRCYMDCNIKLCRSVTCTFSMGTRVPLSNT